MGALPESAGYPAYQTGRTISGTTPGCSAAPARTPARVAELLLAEVGLAERATSRISTYSRGMRQRLGIARALVNDPVVVFLDEPTLGLDPAGQRQVLGIVRDIAARRGATVVTDRKKGVRRFPLNSGPSSPARSLYVSMPSGPSQWAIVDGNGEVLVVGWSAYWDTVEQELFERAAGLPIGIDDRSTPLTAEDLRHDGLYLDDGIWWAYAPRAASLALPVGAITQAGWFPAVLGWLIVAALMVFMVVGMTSGAYGKGRRGKGAAALDALMAGDKEL